MGANAVINVMRTNGGERRRWVINFRPNGASQPLDVIGVGGVLISVTRTDVGIHSVRFRPGTVGNPTTSGGGPRIVGLGTDLQFNAVTGNRSHLALSALQANGEFWIDVVTVNSAGAQTDFGPASAIRVTVWIETDEMPV